MPEEKIYSEFELEQQYIKVAGADSYINISCAGTCKVTKTVKKATKKCRGVVKKCKPKVTAVDLEVSAHIPRNIYNDICGLNTEGLKKGIYATNRRNTFKEFSLTQDIRNEDDKSMLKAYPNCILSEAPEISIDNSSDEVAEVTLKISVMPDEYGTFEYEGLKDDMESEVQSAWLTNFQSSLALVSEV